MKNKATVATPSPQMAAAYAARRKAQALMGGTDAMIEAGTEFLPPHPGEMQGGKPNANYLTRLKSNTLTNFLSQAIDKQVGKLFSKPIQIGENVPSEIAALLENIDLQGRNLDAFAMDVVKAAFVDGISYIMADYPKTGEVRTLAEEKAQGARPYAVHIKACCLLEALSMPINGVETLTRVRIMENTMQPVPDSFDYAEVEQVRVLKRVVDAEGKASIWYELWQEDEKAGLDDTWIKIEEGKTGFPAITIVPIYTNRTGFMMGLPPNQNIAELNLRHWRSMSEQIWATTFGRFGMLACTGMDPDSVMGIGPGKKLASSSPEAKFYIVEPTGKGVEMGRLDLESIEKAIETASATLRVERGGTVTATAAAIDSADSNAGLKAIAGGIKDSLELMLQYFAQLMGKSGDQGGELVVNDDFGTRHGSDAGLVSLDKQRALGDISRNQYSAELKWRGERRPDFDEALNDEELSQEAPTLDNMGVNNVRA